MGGKFFPIISCDGFDIGRPVPEFFYNGLPNGLCLFRAHFAHFQHSGSPVVNGQYGLLVVFTDDQVYFQVTKPLSFLNNFRAFFYACTVFNDAALILEMASLPIFPALMPSVGMQVAFLLFILPDVMVDALVGHMIFSLFAQSPHDWLGAIILLEQGLNICFDLVKDIEKPIVQDGYVTVPEKPGIGVELNEDVVKEYLVEGEKLFVPTPEWNEIRAWDRLWS